MSTEADVRTPDEVLVDSMRDAQEALVKARRGMTLVDIAMIEDGLDETISACNIAHDVIAEARRQGRAKAAEGLRP